MAEAAQHINCLDLGAAILTFKSFLGEGIQSLPQGLGQQRLSHILLEMDNTTAVNYVNRRGVTYPFPTGLGAVVLPADTPFMGNSPSLIRSAECGSRCSLEGIQFTHRLDTLEGCLQRHITFTFWR